MTAITGEVEYIELLARCEEQFNALYECYVASFAGEAPEVTAFWQQLAKDETLHARWVRSLEPRVQRGEIWLRDNRYNPESATLLYAYATQRVREARQAAPSLVAALAIAVDLETTLVEKNFYAVFDTADADAQRALKTLSNSAEEHLRRVKAMWQRYK